MRRWLIIPALVLCFAVSLLARRALTLPAPVPLVTGRTLARLEGVAVGGFPAQMAASPDGRWIALVSIGARPAVHLIDAASGRVLDRAMPSGIASLYAGLAWDDQARLYVACGPANAVAVYRVRDQKLLADGLIRVPPVSGSSFIAGLAIDGSRLYAVHNESSPASAWHGGISVVDLRTQQGVGACPVAAFPYAVAALTRGPGAHRKIYASSERDGCVMALDVSATAPRVTATIPSGGNPIALALDGEQRRLFVANAGGDSVTVIDTATDTVLQTLSLRPTVVANLPGMTPTALVCKGDTLYVALGDFNAVAVVDATKTLRLRGFVPAGWYPTALEVSEAGLVVANAKGTRVRHPNDPHAALSHPMDIIDGSVTVIPATADAQTSQQVLRHARVAEAGHGAGRSPQPGIRHVIYVIKENRTYDEVLGDMPQGNGDPRLVFFGRDVTPNQHALAERFVLLDGFHCSGEVSADGWNWSTAGMTSAYTARNVPFYYTHPGREYDFEGDTNNVPVDLQGMPDVARPPSGYLWDLCIAHGVSFRNYGFFSKYTDDEGRLGKRPQEDGPSKRALEGATDVSFRCFDLSYADSDAWVKSGLQVPTQLRAFGRHAAVSRMAEFRNEFVEFCKNKNLPAMTFVRLPRDHTSGTRRGVSSPRAMVADNDYALGQLVELVSHSPYWRDTAIFVVEDDAQNGFDHVDCHRSTCFVISPWVKAASIDHRFYNTDSVLHTMERLMGLPPMGQFDAAAPLLDVFADAPLNDAPYRAILPDGKILTEINSPTAYRAEECERYDWVHPDRVPDAALNDILWHSIKGDAPVPAVSQQDDDD